MIIKICGLKTQNDIAYVNELKPDYIGFVFAKGRKRTIDMETAGLLKERLDKDIKAVGVFVDDPLNEVLSLLDDNIIDAAQLHGDEDEAYIKALKEKTDKPVIKAFVVKEDTDIDLINNSPADMILLDSGQGSGKKLNEELIRSVKRDYILAGGLSPDNVGGVLLNRSVHLIGLDVSSGVETDGAKDREKIELFIKRVRNEEKR
ncbi:MAG: phosphoribosylanthranilate isomerase [Lachnospiraceae bacterium]|nr:phosphoribosylanthranilate isomerase [Lachnospiraceae bacterium]